MARLNSRSSNSERDALLAAHRPFASPNKLPADADKTTKLKAFLNTNVSTRRADILLIISFWISGMIDAGAYNAYECFTSMQTGNTVFAALGVSDLPKSAPKLAWVKSLVSIISFFLGSLVLTAVQRHLGERKRWVLSASFFVQAIVIAISAVMVHSGTSSGSSGSPGGKSVGTAGLPKDPGFPWSDLIPIGLLSFQAAGKVVASRATGQNALPVVVLTTLYNDLISDPALFTAGLAGNVQRNRRLGGMVMYFGGAVVGGVCASKNLGFSGGLYVACGIQCMVALGWLVWYSDEIDEDED